MHSTITTVQAHFAQPYISFQIFLLFGVLVPIIMLPVFILYYSCYQRIGWSLRRAFWAAILGETLILFRPDLCKTIWDLAGNLKHHNRLYPGTPQSIFPCLAVLGLGVFVVPLGVLFYEKAFHGRVTDAERQPGAEDLRAWLSGWNLFWAVGTALCAWAGYGYSFWLVLLVILALLSAYPIMNGLSAPVPPPPDENLAAERGRVLRLLEEGKITAEECSELLTALGESVQRQPVPPPPVSRGRKLAFLGMALVIAGFLLPWLSIDVNKLTMQMQQQLIQSIPGILNLPQVMGSPSQLNPPGNFNFKFNGTSFSGNILRVSGGDVPHGLGWVVLLLAVAAAFVPFISLWNQPPAQRKLSLAALGVGAFIIFYLLTQNFRFASIGLAVVAAGYALELAGVVKDRPAAP